MVELEAREEVCLSLKLSGCEEILIWLCACTCGLQWVVVSCGCQL